MPADEAAPWYGSALVPESAYDDAEIIRRGGANGGVTALSLKQIRNLDYTILLCDNMKETKAFYKDVMGFPVEDDQENWVTFRVGATLLTLRPRGRWAAWEDGPLEPGSAAVQLAFRVPPPAVDACHEELIAGGVPIVRGPTDQPNSRHRTLFFRDPEDNVIEIYAEY